ncbi:hypothetical protein F5B22DRAFT_10347 [Xylaria bambusicola]|uniref:uncharacterized protein n=1 Tax=Xylaria bambusicola TaxID=326684 RepID=UPI002008A402|nr:uncharacterized protein F5B22DRAFT_10347 [Xylaria bambusicola]KAI0527911.1 hypothetical protein F5B22DRAFT_10347 [Xylaria bambusicola]
MDNAQIAGSPAPSPAKGKLGNLKKAVGRGAGKKNGRKNAAAPRRGGRPKGRGRNKTYEDPRVQAAYDRQKVLRDLYSEVASAVKPVLEDLADMTVKTLIETPTAHKAVPEYHVLQRKLDSRLEEVMRSADREFTTRTAIATREYQLNTAVTEQKFHDGYDYAAEEFYDASLKRAGLLAEIQHEGVDINLPDTTYTFVEQPDHVAAEQGTWVVFRNGIKVPYPHLLEENKKAAAAKVQVTKGKPFAKRKAEDQPDGQPDTKKTTGSSGLAKLDNGDEMSTPQPRHIKGLLSAETEPDGEPESNAASPSPELDPRMEVSRGRRDLPDLPNGASEPDKWGVRIVARRGPRANNRLILPPPFIFDADEIGFRDSTNDSSKKATRGTRGRFLDNPNSRNLHIDRTIVTYDCLEYEDDALDSSLVQKHNIHPKYGLFLPDSRNEPESPPHPVSGSHPIVMITPSGTTLHASRSVRGYNMDATLREDARKDKISLLITQYCEESGIKSDEVTTEEMRKRERERQRRILEEAPIEAEDTNKRPVDDRLDTGARVIDESIARENTNRLLHAASCIEQERQDRPNHPTSSQRSSRPYDAVRDVFTSAGPSTPPPMPPVEIDTFGLSFLADVSEQISLQREAQFDPALDHRLEHHVEYRPDYPMEHHPHIHYEYRPEYVPDHRPTHHLDPRLEQPDVNSMGDSMIDPMIDPRLLGPSNPPPPPSNAFLQTALNPPSMLPHIAPAPPQGIELPNQAPVGRNPFTNQGSGKGSPVLPPLRPSRREKAMDSAHPPPPSLIPQGPDYGPPLGMIQSNSGNFFPPAPSRPYHQGYTLFEQPMMGIPFGMSSQPPPHLAPSHRPAYQPSSPTMSTHAQIAAMPMHMPHGSSVSPPGSSMGLQSPTGPPGSRHRASMSSGSNGPGNGKYRKIAAAPIPHNRPWPSNGGAELRLAHYDHKEAIKDYRANEPPPRTGPTTIRGWNVNNVSKGRKGLKKEDSEEKDSPSITTFINKWNPSEKSLG